MPRSPSLAHYATSPALPAADRQSRAQPTAPAPPATTLRRRRRTSSAAAAAAVPTRKSTRLANKAPTHYVHAEDKATRRKALLDSLKPCSGAVKSAVKKHGMMLNSQVPLSIPGLRKLVKAAGLGCKAANAVGVVPAIVDK